MAITVMICLYSVALILAMLAIYKMWENVDGILDMVSDLAIAMQERDKKLEEMQETLDKAEELIEVTKEATEEQLKAEKALRKGIESIFNY